MSKVSRKEEDILRLLAAGCHLGTQNINNEMKQYVSHKNSAGVHIINVHETWQKIKLAARVIVTVENQNEVIVVSSRPYGQRAVIKFGQYTGAQSTSTSRWTPGTLTNQNTKQFQEPKMLIVTDPFQDRQAIVEASYVNIPCIALCDADSPLQYVDVAIPCNNRSTESISQVYWLLTREVMILRGQLGKDQDWDVKVDMFFVKDDSFFAKNEDGDADGEGNEIELEKDEEKPTDKVDDGAAFDEDS